MTSDILVLVFNETVNASSFNQSALNMPDGDVRYTLQDSYVALDMDSTEIYIQLSESDANELKRLPLATSPDDTYLSVDSTAVQDTSGNYVMDIFPNEALNTSRFTEDSLEPQLLSFNFNVSTGELTLSFSETVSASTLDVTSITLQSVANVSTINGTDGQYQLTLQSSSSADNSNILIVTVQGDDLNNIKRDTNLAVSNSSTFLSIQYGAVQDMNSNPVEAREGLPVNIFYDDFIPPELVAFNLYLPLQT